MSEMRCPNCGRHLVNYRTDRQAAGRREIELKWRLCVHCRHVALESWSFADGIMPSELLDDGTMETRPRRAVQSMRQRTSKRA